MPTLARDIMTREVATATPAMSIDDLCEIFQTRNVKGVPVVDEAGRLRGIVTESDVVFGGLGRGQPVTSPAEGKLPGPGPTTVGEIMTEPAISVEEDTDVLKLAELMWKMRIHRLPICRDGRLTGMVSALDICQALTEGKIGTPLKPRAVRSTTTRRARR
ncbi:MAG TPA: CBS domain-containing protein [Candidatus Polarisedimenticolia bacterium]|nr:CBS domain-containing protein [Candidatus Polarisedimenticolia bacterium]